VNRPLPRPIRIARSHGRLVGSFAAGLLLFLLLPADARLSTRILVGWNVSLAIYLVLAFVMISRFDLQRVRNRAASQDEGGLLILVLTVAAAVASLAAIIAELGSMRGANPAGGIYIAVAVLTILLSWTFIHVIFALHYAHEYYGERRGEQVGGLAFPQDDRPDYWDFVYFSFVIGMAFQVSDVQVTNKLIRRIVVAHGAVSFVYNVAILALMVNIGSEFIR
jgi:uncharacterized membrane protein